jgi:hypothetical protein
MVALLTTLALLATSWVVHFVWWRIRRPQQQTLGILVVFALTPVVAAILGHGAFGPPPGDFPGMILLYLGATGCYVITYAGVEEYSPSLVMVRTIEAGGAHGCSRQDLERVITDDAFIAPRLHALRRDGMVAAAGTGFALTPRGRRVARTSERLARLFGLRGGG